MYLRFLCPVIVNVGTKPDYIAKPISNSKLEEKVANQNCDRILGSHVNAAVLDLVTTRTLDQAFKDGRKFLTKSVHNRVRQIGITVYDVAITKIEYKEAKKETKADKDGAELVVRKFNFLK